MPTKSTSPDIDIKIFCQNPCCITTPTLPCVLTRAFASVEGKNACRAPTARAVSFVEKLCFNSAPRAVLVRGFTMWYHEAFKVSSLSLHDSKCYVHVNKLMFVMCTIFSFQSSHRIAHRDKEAVEKAPLKPKPALNLSNAPVAMSAARSAPMVNRELPPMPTTPDKFATGSYVLEEFRISPIPPAIPTKGFSYCSSTCYHNDACWS